MSITAPTTRSTDQRIRTQNYNFSKEKLKGRQELHLKRIEQTLKAIESDSPLPAKTRRPKFLRRYFGFELT